MQVPYCESVFQSVLCFSHEEFQILAIVQMNSKQSQLKIYVGYLNFLIEYILCSSTTVYSRDHDGLGFLTQKDYP